MSSSGWYFSLRLFTLNLSPGITTLSAVYQQCVCTCLWWTLSSDSVKEFFLSLWILGRELWLKGNLFPIFPLMYSFLQSPARYKKIFYWLHNFLVWTFLQAFLHLLCDRCRFTGRVSKRTELEVRERWAKTPNFLDYNAEQSWGLSMMFGDILLSRNRMVSSTRASLNLKK